MLQFLNISNIALIDDMQVEFESGLNLLTGETGSGKSIIVDALGVLIGGRFTSELLKSGTERGSIEGLFSVTPNPELEVLLENAGLEPTNELIIRREISVNRAQQDLHQQSTRHALVAARSAAVSRRHSRAGRSADAVQSGNASRNTRRFRGQRLRCAIEVAEAYQRWTSCAARARVVAPRRSGKVSTGRYVEVSDRRTRARAVVDW